MKDFRVAKCLDIGVENKPVGISDYAIFADKSLRSKIYTDHFGEYFRVRNELLKDIKPNEYNRSDDFRRNIKDAVELVRMDYGDLIIPKNRYGETHIDVRYYLDRTIGEKVRNRTINTWKYAKFGYAIEYDTYFKLNRINVVSSEFDIIPLFSNHDDRTALIFENEEEARKFRKETINCVYKWVVKRSINARKFRKEKINDILEEIKETENKLAYKIVSDIVKNNIFLFYQNELPYKMLNVIQCII